MRIPFVDKLHISESKIQEYLLSEKHPVGRSKADLFKQFGYSLEHWSDLSEGLKMLAQQNEVTTVEQSRSESGM
jgi:hypothetical protein